MLGTAPHTVISVSKGPGEGPPRTWTPQTDSNQFPQLIEVQGRFDCPSHNTMIPWYHAWQPINKATTMPQLMTSLRCFFFRDFNGQSRLVEKIRRLRCQTPKVMPAMKSWLLQCLGNHLDAQGESSIRSKINVNVVHLNIYHTKAGEVLTSIMIPKSSSFCMYVSKHQNSSRYSQSLLGKRPFGLIFGGFRLQRLL